MCYNASVPKSMGKSQPKPQTVILNGETGSPLRSLLGLKSFSAGRVKADGIAPKYGGMHIFLSEDWIWKSIDWR